MFLPIHAAFPVSSLLLDENLIYRQFKSHINELHNCLSNHQHFKTSTQQSELLHCLDQMLDKLYSITALLDFLADHDPTQWATLKQQIQQESNQVIEAFNNSEASIKALQAIVENPGSPAERLVAQRLLESTPHRTSSNKKQNIIQQQLNMHEADFIHSLQQAEDNWYLHLHDKTAIAGIPDNILKQAADIAAQNNVSGYVLTLDFQDYIDMMSNCHCRQTREQLYRGFVTCASKASPNGDYDNEPVIRAIHERRSQLAETHGYENFAEWRLRNLSLNNGNDVQGFLVKLNKALLPAARTYFAKLTEFARTRLEIADLLPYDIWYVAHCYTLQSATHQAGTNTLQFPLHTVIDQLLKLLQQLFIFDLELIDKQDDNLRVYEVYRQKHLSGLLYLNTASNSVGHRVAKTYALQKQWCRTQGRQIPVAYVYCPLGSSNHPDMVTHTQLQTLFHEFGHTLHHLFSESEYALLSGIESLGEDMIEFPSVFLEQLAWEPQIIDYLLRSVPAEQRPSNDMIQTQCNRAFSLDLIHLLRQMEIALFDTGFHSSNQLTSTQSLMDEARTQCNLYATPEYNRYQNRLSHLFGGGYEAIYYLYFWNEVLALQAIARFKQAGLLDQACALQFKQLLLQSNGVDKGIDLFSRFCGEPTDIRYYLTTYGLTTNHQS